MAESLTVNYAPFENRILTLFSMPSIYDVKEIGLNTKHVRTAASG